MSPTQQDPGTVITPPDGVVCGVDGSEHAADAAWAAARAADRMGLGLQLVRAFAWPSTGVPGLPAGDRGRSVARRSAMAELFRLADGLAAAHPASSVAGALTEGTALSVLTDATAHASLLVVGARGHSGREGPRTGSVAVGIALTTQCPLLVYRSAPPGGTGQDGVVVAVDGGPSTDELLAIAARAAGEDGLLTVIEKSPVGDGPRAPSSLGAVVDALRDAHPGLLVEQRHHDGPPGALLVELSATASLVVVGRPGGPSEALLPERVSTVLRRGTCSTLLVPLGRPRPR